MIYIDMHVATANAFERELAHVYAFFGNGSSFLFCAERAHPCALLEIAHSFLTQVLILVALVIHLTPSIKFCPAAEGDVQ